MRWTILAVLLLFGCEGREFPSLDRVEAYAGEVADALQVGAVSCDAALLIVGERMQCRAFNGFGTELVKYGQSVAIWSTSDPAIATVDLDGYVTARAPGSVTVSARGEGGTTAGYAVTIEL